MKIEGHIKIEIEGKTIEQKNMVVNGGLDAIVLALTSATAVKNEITKVAVGSSSQAVAASDTTLVSQIEVAAFDSMSVDTSISGVRTITFAKQFSSTQAVGTINELGLFLNNGTDDILFSRAVLASPIVKGNVTMNVTWDIELSS